jgi:hypothetical protein
MMAAPALSSREGRDMCSRDRTIAVLTAAVAFAWPLSDRADGSTPPNQHAFIWHTGSVSESTLPADAANPFRGRETPSVYTDLVPAGRPPTYLYSDQSKSHHNRRYYSIWSGVLNNEPPWDDPPPYIGDLEDDWRRILDIYPHNPAHPDYDPTESHDPKDPLATFLIDTSCLGCDTDFEAAIAASVAAGLIDPFPEELEDLWQNDFYNTMPVDSDTFKRSSTSPLQKFGGDYSGLIPCAWSYLDGDREGWSYPGLNEDFLFYGADGLPVDPIDPDAPPTYRYSDPVYPSWEEPRWNPGRDGEVGTVDDFGPDLEHGTADDPRIQKIPGLQQVFRQWLWKCDPSRGCPGEPGLAVPEEFQERGTDPGQPAYWDQIDGTNKFGGCIPFNNLRVTGGRGELPLRPAPDLSNRFTPVDPGIAQGLSFPPPVASVYERRVDPAAGGFGPGAGRPLADGFTTGCTGFWDTDGDVIWASANRDPKSYASTTQAGLGRGPACLKPGGAAGQLNQNGFTVARQDEDGPYGALFADAGFGEGDVLFVEVDDFGNPETGGSERWGAPLEPIPCDPNNAAPLQKGVSCEPLRYEVSLNESTPNGELFAGGWSPQNALESHSVDQGVFACVCDATPSFLSGIDFGACALNLFNSPAVLNETLARIPFAEVLACLLAGETSGDCEVYMDFLSYVLQDRPLPRPTGLAPLNRDGNDGVITAMDPRINKADAVNNGDPSWVLLRKFLPCSAAAPSTARAVTRRASTTPRSLGSTVCTVSCSASDAPREAASISSAPRPAPCSSPSWWRATSATPCTRATRSTPITPSGPRAAPTSSARRTRARASGSPRAACRSRERSSPPAAPCARAS